MFVLAGLLKRSKRFLRDPWTLFILFIYLFIYYMCRGLGITSPHQVGGELRPPVALGAKSHPRSRTEPQVIFNLHWHEPFLESEWTDDVLLSSSSADITICMKSLSPLVKWSSTYYLHTHIHTLMHFLLVY